MSNQIEIWFRLADEDKDGAIAGAEAVKFFTKSGLPQDVLGQIWEYSSGGGAKLNVMQFTTALRLVSLAQASGGRLQPDQARVVAMGAGPQLPPPRLAGVTDVPPTPSIPTYTPQITGLTPQVTGGMPPVAAGATGAYVMQPTGGQQLPPYRPQATGAPGYPGVAPQVTGAASAGATGAPGGPAAAAGLTGPHLTGGAGTAGGLPGFPLFTPMDLQRYQATFLSTDADRDGVVKGGECFPVFMQSGLDKATLKRMWDLVAGNSGQLNQAQFFKCMYLMDGMRRGAHLPAVLPPGPWPQVATGAPVAGLTGASAAAAGLTGMSTSSPLPSENWTLDSQFGNKGAVKAISDAYDQTLPRIPDLPGKIKYEGPSAAVATGPSAVPDLDSAVASMLAPADKARWEAEQEAAKKKEQQQREAEAEAAAAKARIEAFQAALSELVMFKSKTDVALLQASDSAARMTAEAEDMEVRYNRAHLAAQSQAEAGSKARQELQALLARKQEAANKLDLLQEELKMMQNLNPAELVALEKEVGGLVAQVAAAESRKAALEMQRDSGRKQKELLSNKLSDLELAAAAGEGEVRRAKEELAQLQGKVSSAQVAGVSEGALGDVGPLLTTAASAYRRLFSTAVAAGMEVPYEANLSNVGSLIWLEQLLTGTAEWVDDEQVINGYSVVNALPDLEGPALVASTVGVEVVDPDPLDMPADAAAAAALAEQGVPEPEPAAALPAAVSGGRRSLADEDDSEMMSSELLSPADLSGVHPAPAGLGGLAGFDPAAYRLADSNTSRALGQQYSVDSSFAGSFVAEPSSAGGTGASAGGFEDDAFAVSSGTTGQAVEAAGRSGTAGPAETSSGGATAGVGFEDNAF
eukprot:gene3445-3716_t